MTLVGDEVQANCYRKFLARFHTPTHYPFHEIQVVTYFISSESSEEMYWNKIGTGHQGIWVDKLSRKIFPLVYTVFNFIYWMVCCLSGHQEYPPNVDRHPIALIES